MSSILRITRRLGLRPAEMPFFKPTIPSKSAINGDHGRRILQSTLRPAYSSGLFTQRLRFQTAKTPFFQSTMPSIGLQNRDPGHRILQSTLRRAYSTHQPQPSTSKINMYVLYGLIGINCGVWGYYQYISTAAKQGIIQPLISFRQNFLLNLTRLTHENRYYTLLTSVFTHMSFMHLLGNMMSLYYMGQLLALTPGIGPGRLLTLFLGSALSGSAGWLFQRAQKTQGTNRPDNKFGLGASGGVMGIGAAAACMYPRTTFQLYGIVPVPLWGIMVGYLIYDGYYLSNEQSSVGHAGHLGGLAFGLLYYFAKLRRGIIL